MAKQYILAVSPNEGGTPDEAAVERGVNMRLHVDVTHTNPPPGASVSVSQSGANPGVVTVGKPQVRAAMALPGSTSPGQQTN